MPLKGLTPGISLASFPSPKPNTGTNTGDATATAGDLATGKTAYAKGVKITGTGANAKRMAQGSGVTDGTASKLTVTGLAFSPSTIIAYQSGSSGYDKFSVFGGGLNVAEASGLPQAGNCTISGNGFVITMSALNTNCQWTAYE